MFILVVTLPMIDCDNSIINCILDDTNKSFPQGTKMPSSKCLLFNHICHCRTLLINTHTAPKFQTDPAIHISSMFPLMLQELIY